MNGVGAGAVHEDAALVFLRARVERDVEPRELPFQALHLGGRERGEVVTSNQTRGLGWSVHGGHQHQKDRETHGGTSARDCLLRGSTARPGLGKAHGAAVNLSPRSYTGPRS